MLSNVNSIWEAIQGFFDSFLLNTNTFAQSVPPFLYTLFWCYMVISIVFLITRRG